MPERNPREWQIRVCACGREQLQGELGAGVCWHHWDPDGEQFGLEMDRVYTVEDLGPERMIAWALRHAGRGRVVPIIKQAQHEWATHFAAGGTRPLSDFVFDALIGGDET